jgi:hypothetical protein
MRKSGSVPVRQSRTEVTGLLEIGAISGKHKQCRQSHRLLHRPLVCHVAHLTRTQYGAKDFSDARTLTFDVCVDDID